MTNEAIEKQNKSDFDDDANKNEPRTLVVKIIHIT